MKIYKCLSKNSYEYGDYSLVPLREQDIYKIKSWRNAQIDILRQKKLLTDESQKKYYNEIIKPSFLEQFPNQILFSFLYRNECIGYGGFVHIDWISLNAELSFLTETKRNKSNSTFIKDYTNYLSLIKQIAFITGFNKIYTYTYDIRQYLIDTIEANGFVQEGFLKNHILIRNKLKGIWIHSFFKKNNNKQITYKQKNVLITSISDKIPLVENVKNATKKIDSYIKVIGGDITNNCLGIHFTDDFWLMPHTNKLTPEKLIKYCKENSINAIIPTRDGELKYFAKIKEQLASVNISIMVSEPETIDFCLDKLKFYTDTIDSGIPVIPTYNSIKELNAQSFVVKERFGAGSDKIGVNLNNEETINHSKKLINPVFQPFIKGREASVDMYIAKEGKIKGIVMRYRNKVVNGESKITTTFYDLKLENLCQNFISFKPFYGHIILQVIIDENNNYNIIECNSRFGGASTLSIAAGLDSFYWFLLESQNVDISDYIFSYKKDLKIRQIRYQKDKIIIL